MVEMDPDVFTGYNIMNFDLKYIIDRANELKANSVHFCSRISDDYVKYKETTFSSKAYGTKKSYSYNITGRIAFDMLQFIQREYKLRSYTLNAVSTEFLGEQKDDVSHEQIPILFDGTDDDRSRLAHYCYKDSYLVVRLVQKLMCILSYIEMCRTTWVPFSYLLSRGQSIKVLMQILVRCRDQDYVVPTKMMEVFADGMKAKKTDDSDVGYEGAIVIVPK
jgi:DNA polymerase delta subunit 1